jgi:alpha-N-acetylglucosamine transferase
MRPRRSKLWTLSILSLTVVVFWFAFLHFSRPVALDPSYGILAETSSSSQLAIATFLSSSDPKKIFDESEEDFYFVATRTLAYQLLHDQRTRCNKSIPFLVLVTSEVTQDKRDRLSRDGATVVPVEDVPLRWWIKTGITRWKDQFTKLRIFEMVEYDRVLFIDADTLLTRPIDGIFDQLTVRVPSTTLSHRSDQIKGDEAPLPAKYVFGARSDNAFTGERDHPFPPPPTDVFSAGFWLAAPSKETFAYLMSVMNHYRRFDPTTMEQSLLNYAFRREGCMPWIEIDYQWSATWPSLKDLNGGVASLHEKFGWTGPEELRQLWRDAREHMETFFRDRRD